MEKNIYNISKEQTLKDYETTIHGLTQTEAEIRLEKYGKNKLAEGKKITFWGRIFKQLKNTLIIVLLFACALSVLVAILEKSANELVDAGLILIIISTSIIIGVIQETKADNSVESLKSITKPFAKVIRDGKAIKISTEDIVIGDIILLEAGDIVPADLRLIDVASLKIQDSAITGESVPVEKITESIKGNDLALGDMTNIAFMGSSVSYGRGTGIVVNTGMNTEMGKISELLQESLDSSTPLDKRINKTIKVLTYVVLIVILTIFITDLIKGRNIIDSFMVAIALAVCVIPEGLVACIAMTKSVGVDRMSKNKAIVRNMGSVETIGSTQIICSDKTGTLTLNQMTVKQHYILTEENDDKTFKELLNCMVLCNDSKVRLKNKKISSIGDPTETALVNFAYDYNIYKKDSDKLFPRLFELPFDSERKLMTTINDVNGKQVAYIKGAIDNIIEKCSHILDNGKKRAITDEDKENIIAKSFEFGNQALRVLGYAKKSVTKSTTISSENIEKNLTFIGITGMIDPPRAEVKDAVKVCNTAGISVVMITGDHKDTALAIAREIGIASHKNEVITGRELDKISDEELIKILTTFKVFARVNPSHKVRIVKLYQELDKIVAMTGDGVNDAPSIKNADIGIGMGITGTDVTKDVADIILTDDNFATIVTAVEEGRRIYSNILKNIIYLVSTGIAELIMMFTILVIVGQEFFTPALILWLNIIGDTTPALGISMEKSEKDNMTKQPQNHNKSLFNGVTGAHLVFYSIMQAIIILSQYFICIYALGLDATTTITLCFVTLIMIESFQSYNSKSMTNSLFSTNPFDNKMLNIGIILTVLLTALLVQLPLGVIHTTLNIHPITFVQWIICIGVGALVIPLGELYKWIVRKCIKNKNDIL